MPPRTPILLLPGMDGTRFMLRPLVEALPEHLEPIVVEYPADGPCDYAAALTTALAALDALPGDGPVHVLGWSFSGPVAMRLANARPLRVRTVTLVATFVTAPQRWLAVAGVFLQAPVVGLVRTLRRLPLWLLKPPSDPLRQDKAKIWAAIGAATLARRVAAIRWVDARDDLRAVRQPLLYLRSSHDRVVPDHNLARMRALRPDLEVMTIDGDHFALHKNAAAGAAVIAAFVARCQPANGSVPARRPE